MIIRGFLLSLHPNVIGGHAQEKTKDTFKISLKTWKNHGKIVEYCHAVGIMMMLFKQKKIFDKLDTHVTCPVSPACHSDPGSRH